jgi:general stress protein 26
VNEPTADEYVVELDARFSDPGTTATPWSVTREVIAGAELFWICTVRADGRPHATPLVALWHEGGLHFCTGREEQKAMNLAHHRHVVLTTGCNTWDRGLDVVVEGEAQAVTDRETLERLAAGWATKWDGRWEFTAADGGFEDDGGGTALVFRVRPTKVLAFSKGTFTHTRYVPVEG